MGVSVRSHQLGRRQHEHNPTSCSGFTDRERGGPTVDGDATASPKPTGAGFAAGGPVQNPIVKARAVFRKLVVLLMSSGEGGAPPVTFLRDIVLGVMLGVLFVSILLFLDHIGVVHSENARNLRRVHLQLVNDPDTIATIEESSDLKLLTVGEYKSKMKVIDSAVAKIAEMTENLEKKTAEAEEKRKQMKPIREEYDALVSHPALELDKYCGSCMWIGGTTCDARVQYLKDKYNANPIAAKVAAMKDGCKKQT